MKYFDKCIATLVVALAASPATAVAQANPKFEYGKKDEKPPSGVEWTALAKAGLILTTGNSQATSASLGASASRKEDDNKFQGEAALAYVRSNLLVVNDSNGDGMVQQGEYSRSSVTTTESWLVKARYDRFFTEHNSAYLSATVSADKPAGRQLVGGGQIGYSRQLLKTSENGRDHEVVAEAGYDFSYEDYVAAGDAVSIHSARLYAGYTLSIHDKTGIYANLDALFNLNSENTPTGKVDAFGDTRLTGKAGLSMQLLDKITFSIGVTAKYDQAPAPLPAFPGIPFAAGFTPSADKLDTSTEATLIINFV